MVRKLNAWIVGVFILFAIHANGFKLFDSSDEKFDIDLDSDSAIDESDYWDWLSILPNPLRDANKNDKSTENEKLELTDDVGDDDDDDEIDEMVQLIEISEMHVMKKYFLGKRVRGDRVLDFAAGNQTYPQFRDVRSNITYPKRGFPGKKLTYVEIQVNQTSNNGQAYLVRGGIGQTYIAVIVEAYHTLYFNFRATFYGR